MWMIRHKTLAFAVGISLSTLVLIFVAIIPIYQNARTLLRKIETKSRELEELTNKVAILTQLDPGVLQDRVKVLDSALPPNKDLLLYLNSIDGLSRELGLSFGGLSLSPGELSGASGSAAKATKAIGLQRLETEIKMRGGQENIYSFLRTIENVLPLMQIENIKVSVLGDDQYALTLTLAMLWAEPSTMDVKGRVALFGETEEKLFTQLSEYRRFEPITSFQTDQIPQQNLFTPFGGDATSTSSESTKSASIKPQP